MDTSVVSAKPSEHVLVTDSRRVWLRHLLLRCLLASGTAAIGLSPCAASLGSANAADIVPRARWWRTEAARGIAEIEAEARSAPTR